MVPVAGIGSTCTALGAMFGTPRLTVLASPACSGTLLEALDVDWAKAPALASRPASSREAVVLDRFMEVLCISVR
jgi:hypothetical protein